MGLNVTRQPAMNRQIQPHGQRAVTHQFGDGGLEPAHREDQRGHAGGAIAEALLERRQARCHRRHLLRDAELVLDQRGLALGGYQRLPNPSGV
jgi:hypothetical protein